MARALTVRGIEQLRAAGRYRDGDTRGLYLQVTDTGSRSWILRFELDKRAREMGLGAYPLVSLKLAREDAREAHLLLRQGIDPIEARLAKRDDQRKERVENLTFKQAVRKFHALHGDTWRNDKHRKQWLASIERYAPMLAERPVRAIDTALINEALAERWTKTPATAARVRERIERVIQWVKDGSPLPTVIAVRNDTRHAALPFSDIPAFMDELRQRDGVTARALEALVLTATRTGDILGSKWSEIDLNARVWTIPAHRTKQGSELRVPLADRTLEILRGLPREESNEHAFIGARSGGGLGHNSLLKLVQAMRPGVTTHGFRASFKTWASEATNHLNMIAEMSLGHAVGSEVEQAYQRSDLFAKRAALMRDWAAFCASTPAVILNLREAAS